MSYAEGTTVPVHKSQMEIKQILDRYGASGWAMGEENGQAAVMFTANGRRVRFILPLPRRDDPQFSKTATGIRRDSRGVARAYDAEVRRRWRALAFAIKAKLEAVATGIVDFETEFLGHIVLPDNSTVADHLAPALAEAYQTGTVPALLPAFTRREIERS